MTSYRRHLSCARRNPLSHPEDESYIDLLEEMSTTLESLKRHTAAALKLAKRSDADEDEVQKAVVNAYNRLASYSDAIDHVHAVLMDEDY